MTTLDDPITEDDLNAYVDDHLEVGRRIAVEAHLAAHPALAARMMGDLRVRDELRLALAGWPGAPRPRTTEAARRLERSLGTGRLIAFGQRAAAVVALVGAGWLGHASLGTALVAEPATPSFVEDAARAYATTVLRARMSSQPEVAAYDPAELRAETAIVMPALPDDWVVRDVQVFPSRFGPSVDMALDTAEFGRVSLFAVRPGGFAVVTPTMATVGATEAAYFQIGEVAYAVVAGVEADGLDRAARRLFASLH